MVIILTENKQPTVELVFKQLASTMISRGSRGKVGLIVFDSTDTSFDSVTYRLSSSVDKSKFTTENYDLILDAFIGTPSEVTVIRVNSDGDIADALGIVKSRKLDWIGTASPIQADQNAVAQFVKEQEALRKNYKCIVYNPTTAPDCKHAVKLVNSNVTFTDSKGSQATYSFIPTLLGILAGLALNRSATYYEIPNLKEVVDVANIDTEISNGGLVLFNDEGKVKISTAVNSLTTLDANNTALMTKIENIEALDMIYSDIVSTFKNNYLGKGKNTADRQFLFIGALKSYFDELEKQEILDPNYTNSVFIDITSQRAALKALKGDVVDSWPDETIANTPVGTKMFLGADIKLLEAIENLQYIIGLF